MCPDWITSSKNYKIEEYREQETLRCFASPKMAPKNDIPAKENKEKETPRNKSQRELQTHKVRLAGNEEEENSFYKGTQKINVEKTGKRNKCS